MSQKSLSSAQDYEEMIDICYDFFDQRDFGVEREVPIHPDVGWSPSVTATKGRLKVAIEVRAKPTLPDFLRVPIREARRVAPNVKIYCAVPPNVSELPLFQAELKRNGIGLYRIRNKRLEEVFPPVTYAAPPPRTIKLPTGRVVKPTIVLLAEKQFDAYLKISQIVGRAKKYVKVIDPYCREGTLRYFLRAPKSIPFFLVTTFDGNRSNDEVPFTSSATILKQERPAFITKKCARKLLHDRYIITESETWIVTQSINETGNKFGLVVMISEVGAKRWIHKHFNYVWSKGVVVV